MTSRIVTPADLAIVEGLFVGDTSGQVASPNPIWWKYVTTSDHVRCILHFVDTQPVAVTQFDVDGTRASVSVFIREGMRGKGLFGTVIAEAMKLLPSTVRSVDAFISEANHASIAAFTKFGFEGALHRDEDGLLVFTFDVSPS
jgi:RimJ/RimL family protein N-acetyltransferase